MRDEARFEPPGNGQRMIERRRLLDSLERADPPRLTIICAPAGYGKTSLGAQWFGALRAQGRRLLWISLDNEQSEQGQFVFTVLDALGFLTGEATTGLDLGSMSSSSLLAVLRTRLRKVEQPLLLFLDDYHTVQTDGTETVLAKLLADPGLEHVKFVLMSRCPPRFPISALRARGELRQVGTSDLCFSGEEANEFFSNGAVSLTIDLVNEFTRRTEGWAVALQMLRLLVFDTTDGLSILASFDGGHGDMGTYLSEQVFANLSSELQEFLVTTACFPSVNRDLVVAVFGRDDLVAELTRLGGWTLPLTVLAGPGGWIRYHPVFHAFLNEEAMRRGIDRHMLLRKAALWLEQSGDCERAIRYALLCDDANLAARIVEAAGGWRLVYSTTRGRAGLFHAILEHAAEIDLPRFPLTALGFAVVTAKAAQLDVADHYLAIAESRINGKADDAMGSDLRVVRVLVALYLDRWVGDSDLSALERDLLETPDMEVVTRALTLNMLSCNYLTRSELERTIQYGQLATHAFRSGGADFGAMHLYTHTGQAWLFGGDRNAAMEAYDQLIEEAQTNLGKGSDLDAVGQVLKAELLSVCGEIDGAEEILIWALPHLERHDTWFDLLAAGFTAQQRTHRVKRVSEAAHASADRARATALRRGFTRLTHLIDGERAALLLADGDVDAAIRYACGNGFGRQTIEADQPNNLAIHLRGITPGLLWTRIYLAQGEPEKARVAFDQVRIRQSHRPHRLRQIEMSLLEIRIMLAEGNRDSAAVRLSDLMLTMPVGDFPTLLHIEGDAFCAELRTMADSYGLPRVIRQRLAVALAGHGLMSSEGGAAQDGSHSAGGLTDRECQVVDLLCTGLSNKQIGRRLALSDNTVKFHLHNIYAKLNVHTRTAAVIAARDLATLPQ